MSARPARELLREATRRLRAAGVSTPEVDAELLLAACLGVGRGRLALVDEVAPERAAAFTAAVARRERREPLQHIVGIAPFRHLEIAVGAGVFVPRPETELLVDAVLPVLRAVREPRAVDLCAGSGALALALAAEVPGALVWAVENAPAALTWLRRNTEGTSVTVVAADVRDPQLLAELSGRVDVVVSNPPYVPESTTVPAEVRADPAGAVFAGPDGLRLIPAVLSRAAHLLRPGGRFALEHDESQGDAVANLLAENNRWTGARVERDLTGRPRFTVAERI
jgi:release factor glutamine methyltransferase